MLCLTGVSAIVSVVTMNTFPLAGCEGIRRLASASCGKCSNSAACVCEYISRWPMYGGVARCIMGSGCHLMPIVLALLSLLIYADNDVINLLPLAIQYFVQFALRVLH